jgi:adenylate cyclase
MEAGTQEATVWHFHGFALDPARSELRDTTGTPVTLRPKTQALLLLLLQNAGRVVDRSEILDAVWADVTVSPESVDQAIGELRRALGADATGLIRTIPRRGYMLDAQVQAAARPQAGPARGAPPMLAVLPFENFAQDKRWSRFGDGLAEDIITDLARQPDLRVIARTSSFAWRGRAVDLREIGRALGAAYVLEGSVQAAEGEVSVTGQLIDAATGAHVWAQRYRREEAGLFAIQAEIVARVAAAIGGFAGSITRAERLRRSAAPPASLDAYELYLRGYEAELRFDRDGTQDAIRLLEAAVLADPGFSRAWTVLGFALGNAASNGWTDDPEACRARQGVAIRRAAELDPEDGVALEELGAMLARLGDIPGACAVFERAAEAGANQADALALLAKYMAEVMGRTQEAERMMERAFELNPAAPSWYWLGATRVAYFAGRFEEAAALAMRAPALRLPRLFRVLALASLGRAQEAALALLEHRERFSPGGVAAALASLPPLCAEAAGLLDAGLARAGLRERLRPTAGD